MEHIHDHLDMELNLEQQMARMAALTAGHQPRTHKHYPDCQHVHGKVQFTTNYPEGGSSMIWITDGSSATDDNDDNKENNILRFIFSQLSSHKYFPSSADVTDLSTTEPLSSHNSSL